MKTIRYLLIINLFFLCTTASAQQIDIKKSHVQFKVKNLKVKTVEGRFKGMSGEVDFDWKSVEKAKFNVCIDAATINTENKKRDKHLKNEDFFDVEKYPKICFESTEVITGNDGYKAKGNLTMHGITKPIEIPFLLDGNTLAGNFIIKRLDFGIGKDTGTFALSDEVEVSINCVLLPQEDK